MWVTTGLVATRACFLMALCNRQALVIVSERRLYATVLARTVDESKRMDEVEWYSE